MLKRTFTLIFPLSFLSQAALAAEQDVYFGGNLDLSYASGACQPHNLSCDNTMSGGSIYLGYSTHEWLAVETGYHYLGKVVAHYPALLDSSLAARYQGEVQAMTLALKPSYSLTPDFEAFAKLGAMVWRNEVSGKEVDFDYRQIESGVSPLIGIGTEWQLDDHWQLRLEYNATINDGNQSIGGHNIHIFSFGFNYRFADDKSLLSYESVLRSESEITVPAVMQQGAEK